MTGHYLYDSWVENILKYLKCPPQGPTLRYLNQLILAYIHAVPWESVSRIIKRHNNLKASDCPRWPEEFWQDALQSGFGGTCYESSLAFYSLLMSLGYEGYLTVNDMGDSRGCHAAIVLLINMQKYLVDITIPLHAAVKIDPHKIVRRRTAFRNYTVRPVQENKYEVERSHHPHKNAFTLIDVPVSLGDYQIIVVNDYRDTGYFLDKVVMVKLIEGKTWRFVSDEKPFKLENFSRSGKSEDFLDPETMPHKLAELFRMPEDNIIAALTWTSNLPAILGDGTIYHPENEAESAQ